jgi:hypothetical protein
MLELDDLRDLLDGHRGATVDKSDIEGAIQGLLAHQIVYADTAGFKRDYFELIRRHAAFFERYFNAMGHRLVIEPAAGMIALAAGTTRYGWRMNRLRKDESLVLIALRLSLDEGFRAGRMDESGRVETNTDEIYDQIRTLAGAEPPTRGRLEEILKWLRRHGGVILGDRDAVENLVPVTVLPGIRILADDGYIEAVIKWIEQGATGDLFDFIAGANDAAGSGDAEEADDASGDGTRA